MKGIPSTIFFRKSIRLLLPTKGTANPYGTSFMNNTNYIFIRFYIYFLIIIIDQWHCQQCACEE